MFSDDLPPPQQQAAPAPVASSSSLSNHNSINDEKTDRGENAGSWRTGQSAQGSSVHKLQYISELERSVTALQMRVELCIFS
jgi:cyclic AMP-dependent transcription factor ATF-4